MATIVERYSCSAHTFFSVYLFFNSFCITQVFLVWLCFVLLERECDYVEVNISSVFEKYQLSRDSLRTGRRETIKQQCK